LILPGSKSSSSAPAVPRRFPAASTRPGSFKDWSDRLVPGERGTVLVIAADRRQARVIFRYITALITETPLIADLVDGEVTQDRIDLKNGITIEISTANFRSVRGYTLVAAL
jgi:hypothetical protein